MTNVGEARAKYAELFKDTDPHLPRFTNQGADYRAWAMRADEYMERHEHC